MTKAQRGNWYKFCSEPLDKIEHYEEALAEDFKGWCIHHRLEIQQDGTRVPMQQLIDQNLYYGRPASELVFMKVGEHATLHHKDKVISEETRQKIAESHKGKHLLAEHRKKIAESLRGKHLSEETRKKLSEALKGKRHSADTRRKMSMSLKGFYKGTRWWNNGISNTRSRECPGPEWKPGRL